MSIKTPLPPISEATADRILEACGNTAKEFLNEGSFATIIIIYSPDSGVKLYTAAPVSCKGEPVAPPIELFGEILCTACEMLGDTPASMDVTQFPKVH